MKRGFANETSAFIYLDEALRDGRGVFDVVEQLHIRAAVYRSSDKGEGDDFDGFYAEHHGLLDGNIWRKFYSLALLAQLISARFYRLPDLQDLPDSSDPLAQPRHKGNGHLTKLPRWAHNVVRTHRRQPSLPVETITQIALATLEQTIARLREDYVSVQPYSDTQARFWLNYMNRGCPGKQLKETWNHNEFGISVTQGRFDM
ncbi:hypothetical protein CABS01_00894 [Colletotrichum abscissum]|uniref:uncharacterized protein n=1 Tax=Colletotrichum abscissum TaxID=1671311 RepID=UPI0027D6D084|nr:uncharacterized protein CABS01_00894 [Colletotrichum abscissum]KAK1505426.1 hypothetical protein CABS01_00894 [Colletotrichum abscissum]